MTGLASVLRRAGYRTHLVGKWDVGMATALHHPRARGYDSWLGYWHHSNDYWQQTEGSCGLGVPTPRDLWRYDEATGVDGPARELANGPSCSQRRQQPEGERCIFEDADLTDEAVRVVSEHEASEPLFLFWAPHLVHMPLQAPQAYLDAFSFIDDSRRRLMHAMVSLLDDEVGRVVGAVQSRPAMWNQTLVAFHSDNGGELAFAGVCGGNNWPLTGGKFSNFEGGIRVAAFLAGGALPPAVRGTQQDGLMTAWDWLATYAALAGEDPTDHAAATAGLPPIDSINIWPLLSGGNASAPRQEVIIGENAGTTYNTGAATLVGGLLDGAGYKILVGPASREFRVLQYVQTGPSWPNTSSHLVPDLHPKVCARNATHGCLFNVFADPTERDNLAADQPDRFYTMLARVDALQQGVYSPDRGKEDPRACDAVSQRGGYWGPFVE